MATAIDMRIALANFILGKPKARSQNSSRLRAFTAKVNAKNPNPPEKLVKLYRAHAANHLRD